MNLLASILMLLLISKPTWKERKDWEKYFMKAGVQGCFVVYDLKQDTYLVFNPQRVKTSFVPASTYKIPNSLIALETGVIRDEHEVLAWDSVQRAVPSWNHSQHMREAIQNSTVWFYQELAKRISLQWMQHYINLIGYGNQNIGGGIDQFWLSGELRISAEEQISFLRRLHQNDLPFSQRSMNIVKDILINETNDTYTLRAKTGWGDFDDSTGTTREFGWWVGYVERGNNVYFFALNIDIMKDEDAVARKPVARNILTELNIITQPPVLRTPK